MMPDYLGSYVTDRTLVSKTKTAAGFLRNADVTISRVTIATGLEQLLAQASPPLRDKIEARWLLRSFGLL